MRSDELDFHLPPDLIAQEPSADRAESRLLHYRRADRLIQHRRFSDLTSLLHSGDVLVFNDSKVLPAKFLLRKPTGGRIEGLFLSETSVGHWRVLLRNLGHATELHFADDPNTQLRITGKHAGGDYEVEINSTEPADMLLERLGRMPLPPYIKRLKDHDQRDEMDRQRYQTVYARLPGSVAAPTAGLHFTPALLDQLRSIGVEERFVTLHVGMGTFKPISTETLEEHAMHVEYYSISQDTADALNRARQERRRIIAVGTTATRVLESQSADGFKPGSNSTGIFITPSYEWKHVSGMITNFHLPRSTLIALVAALVGLDEQRRIYAEAIRQRYRFFSYGDAMLVE